MTRPAAFRATFSDMKLVKTRQVAQLIFEIPLADFDAAYEILGGLPNPAAESWFGIAPLTPRTEKENRKTIVQDESPESRQVVEKPPAGKRDWLSTPPAQRAGILVNEKLFAAYLREEHPDEWHETGEADACLKFICNIDSKRELATNAKAEKLFDILTVDYRAWQAKERVGA